jgi:hypothetical protein
MPTKRTKGLSRRDKMIMQKRLESESITQIADSVSVAPSTVFRTLKRLEPELIEELADRKGRHYSGAQLRLGFGEELPTTRAEPLLSLPRTPSLGVGCRFPIRYIERFVS